MLYNVHYQILYSLCSDSDSQTMSPGLLPPETTQSDLSRIEHHRRPNALLTTALAQRCLAGAAMCSAPSCLPHRRHMRLFSIIHTLCCMMIIILSCIILSMGLVGTAAAKCSAPCQENSTGGTCDYVASLHALCSIMFTIMYYTH